MTILRQIRSIMAPTVFPRCEPCGLAVGPANSATSILQTSAPGAEERRVMVIGCRTCSGDRRR
jgi:hypothetical protein